jgi:hypothetical protein
MSDEKFAPLKIYECDGLALLAWRGFNPGINRYSYQLLPMKKARFRGLFEVFLSVLLKTY